MLSGGFDLDLRREDSPVCIRIGTFSEMNYRCSNCGRVYDLSNFPPNYSFNCTCGEVITKVPAEDELLDYSDTQRVSVPSSEDAPSFSDDEGEELLDGERQESTAVSPSPFFHSNFQQNGAYPEVPSSPHLNEGLPASSWDNSHSTGVTSRQSSGRSQVGGEHNLKQKSIKPLSSHLKEGLSRGLSVNGGHSQLKGEGEEREGQLASGGGNWERPLGENLPEGDGNWERHLSGGDSTDGLGLSERDVDSGQLFTEGEFYFGEDEREDDSILLGDGPHLEKNIKWALFLSFLIILGPVVFYLSLRGRAKLKRSGEGKYRGAVLSLFLFFLGIVETALLVFGVILFLSLDEPVQSITSFFSKLGSDDFEWKVANLPPHPEILTDKLAKELLEAKLGNSGSKLKLAGFFVYQPEGKRRGYGIWREPENNRGMLATFFYSNRNRWHLVSITPVIGLESRCAISGGRTITPEIAENLIREFWKLRGGFSGVRIKSLYTVQRPGSKVARAYWRLLKETREGMVKDWKIRSDFIYSNRGNWHLIRYASPIPSDELMEYSIFGGKSFELKGKEQPILSLLQNYSKQMGLSLPVRIEGLFVEVEGSRAYICWRTKRRERGCSLLRLSTSGRWYLARYKTKIAILQISSGGQASVLPEGVAVELIQRELKRRRVRGRLDKYYIYQEGRGKRAFFRWSLLSAVSGKGRGKFKIKRTLYESKFLLSEGGRWALTEFDTGRKFEVEYARRGGKYLSSDLARSLIKHYWREYDWRAYNSGGGLFPRFSGAKIRELFIYQEKNERRAFAHWSIYNNDLVTPVRTLFFFSIDGRWFLGRYELEEAFIIKYRELGKKRLGYRLAEKLIKRYLSEKYPEDKLKVKGVFCYQEIDSNRAYGVWILESNKKFEQRISLFHRTNDGHWLLSQPEIPHVKFDRDF